jgi:Ser/Thr protein kinase RdoA (MazF antagonist)
MNRVLPRSELAASYPDSEGVLIDSWSGWPPGVLQPSVRRQEIVVLGIIHEAMMPSVEAATVGELVTRDFGRRVVSIEPLPGGETNELWTVTTEADQLVVRVSSRDRTSASLQYEHRVLRQLSPHLPFVVAPVPGIDGETVRVGDGQLVSVFAFIEGVTHMDPDRSEHRRARSVAMGRLHRVTHDHKIRTRRGEVTPRWWGQWPRVRQAMLARPDAFDLDASESDGIVALFDSEYRELTEWIAETERRGTMPTGLIHGDLNPRNVLMAGDEVVAVVDWDACRVEWYATEVSALQPDLLDTYVDAGGIADACDLDALDKLARHSNANEVLWVFEENGLSDDIDPRAGDILREVATGQRALLNRPGTESAS